MKYEGFRILYAFFSCLLYPHLPWTKESRTTVQSQVDMGGEEKGQPPPEIYQIMAPKQRSFYYPPLYP